MIGIPPATAASKKTNELLSLQLLFISFQYLETRALFAVITFFLFLVHQIQFLLKFPHPHQ